MVTARISFLEHRVLLVTAVPAGSHQILGPAGTTGKNHVIAADEVNQVLVGQVDMIERQTTIRSIGIADRAVIQRACHVQAGDLDRPERLIQLVGGGRALGQCGGQN